MASNGELTSSETPVTPTTTVTPVTPTTTVTPVTPTTTVTPVTPTNTVTPVTPIITSIATFTSTATITNSINASILSHISLGQFSPQPFGPPPRTRSSTGAMVKSTHMRLKVSPDKTIVAVSNANDIACSSPSSTPESVPSKSVKKKVPSEKKKLSASNANDTACSSPAHEGQPKVVKKKKKGAVTSTSSSSASPIMHASITDETANGIVHPMDLSLSMTELIDRVTYLENLVQTQSLYNLIQNDKIYELEQKVNNLEGQLMVVNSRFVVRDHVIEGLQGEIQRLEQYTRRYTVSVTGIEKKNQEN